MKLSNRSRNRLEGIEQFLIDVIEIGIVNSPYDFGIPQYGGLRTTKDQQDLYAVGRTEDMGRKPVTYTDGIRKKSNHQMKENGLGWAFDIYIYIPETKSASWNADKLQAVALHLMKVAQNLAEKEDYYKGYVLIWGGNWSKFKDRPHFELKKIQVDESN